MKDPLRGQGSSTLCPHIGPSAARAQNRAAILGRTIADAFLHSLSANQIDNSTMAPLNIIIVGAGVGGLAVATGLARNGHRVTVYERLTSGSEVGYAFRITANSDRCLKHLDIDTVKGGAVAANSSRMFNAQGEVILTLSENADPEIAKRATSVFAYRVLSSAIC